jgi:hypothetical protein
MMLSQPVSSKKPGVQDDGQPGDDAGGQQQDQAQTVEAPLSAFGDVKEGDTVQMKVISVDSQGGVVNLAPMKAEEQPGPGGTDGMADEFADATTMKKGASM